nr:hypothetical protein [Tanacetum cinerariifolium]
MEQCYEKIGYHDWYKGKKNKKGGKREKNPGLDHKLVAEVCQETMKMFNGNNHVTNSGVAPGFMHLAVYVDDGLVTGDSIHEFTKVKKALNKKVTIKEMGEAKYFLGIEVYRTATCTHLNQRKYILYILKDSSLTACKPNSSHLPTNLHLSLDIGVPLSDAGVYKRLVGRLGKLFNDNEILDWVLYFPWSFISLMENKEAGNCV